MNILNALQQTVLQILADGGFHSGEAIARRVGVSRTAVWKALQALRPLGVEVHAVSGRGYRLVHPLELLDKEHILSCLAPENRALIQKFEVLQSVDSTNAWLMRLDADTSVAGCMAEHQSAGRGRRGRYWYSPFARNLYLSLRWRFDEGMDVLAGLSLAVAVGVVRAMRELAVTEMSVKWPNDIYWRGRKLGGILLEVAGETAGPTLVVVGVGLNVAMPRNAEQTIDQPWVDLAAVGRDLSRNHLGGHLLDQLMATLRTFRRTGLNSFMQDWDSADLLRDRWVKLSLPGEEVFGIGRGIAMNGALMLEVDGELRHFTYGEASTRLQDVAA